MVVDPNINITLPTAVFKLVETAQNTDREVYRWSTVAVAKYRNTLVEGWNSNKTSPKYFYEHKESDYEKHSAYNRHAEAHLLQQLDPAWDRRKIKIFVCRINKAGEISMAKPCPSCQIKLSREGILAKNIYYTNREGVWVNLGSYDHCHG